VEVLNCHPLGLAKPITAILGLGVIGRHPIEVLENYVRAGREVDADAVDNQVADGDPHVRIALESIYRFHPLIRRVAAGDGHCSLSQDSRNRISCIIDGEAVACDDNGVASFDLVRHHRANESIFLYAFDLIELNGDDLRRDPLEVRKATLASIVAKARPGIRFNEHLEGDGPTIFAHACKMGLEGIVSKRLGRATDPAGRRIASSSRIRKRRR
jgi:hypothetical protein